MINPPENQLIYQKLKSPVTIQSELTSKCPNGCVYCYNFWRDGKKLVTLEGELQLDDWLKIGKKLVEAEVFKIVLTGGEPLIRKDLVYPLAKFYSSKNIEVKLNTSLVPLKEDDCRKIKDTGIKSIFAGFPSSDEINYNRITNSRNYKKAIRGLELVLKHNIPIAVNMVVNRLNEDEIYRTGEFLHSLGVNSFAATPVIPCLFMDPELELDNEKIVGVLDDLLELEKDYGMNVDIVEAIPRCAIENTAKYEKFLRRDCGAGRMSMAVSSSGKARPCTHSPLEYGNLLEEDVNVIWEKMSEWRDGIFVPESCKTKCGELELCSLGCREAAKYKKGSYQEQDPRANLSYVHKPRLLISRVKDVNKNTELRVVEDIRYREEEKGYLIFSPQNSALVYLNGDLFNFFGYLSRNQPFSINKLESQFEDDNIYSIINFLNMKGVVKP